MNSEKTKEPQYNRQVLLRDELGAAKLGLTTNQLWHDDPRHLLFVLARYKFVSKMLSGKKNVLEVGCGDAFGARIVLQEVENLHAIDFDPTFVKDVNNRMEEKWKFKCTEHDMLSGPVKGQFDAAYSLDVLEHIKKECEQEFLTNVVDSLDKNGVLIIGTPSVQSQVHASPPSKEGHINCKSHLELIELMERFFENVFLFSMNDEVVHTGYYPMAHYLFCIGCTKKLNSTDGK